MVNNKPTDATHYLVFIGRTTYYKQSNGQWYIWSRIEKEPYHWIKTHVSENLLTKIER